MENGLCGAGAALFIYGLLSLHRLTRWARARAPELDPGDAPPRSSLRLMFGRHGEFGACGLLLAVTTGGFFVVVQALFGAAGLDPGGAIPVAIALALGIVATTTCTQALVDLARTRARCADLEAAALGALRKVATLDAERRTSALCLARALREKEEAEQREAAERAARERDHAGRDPVPFGSTPESRRAIPPVGSGAPNRA